MRYKKKQMITTVETAPCVYRFPISAACARTHLQRCACEPERAADRENRLCCIEMPKRQLVECKLKMSQMHHAETIRIGRGAARAS